MACLLIQWELNYPDSEGLILVLNFGLEDIDLDGDDTEVDVGDDGDSDDGDDFTLHGVEMRYVVVAAGTTVVLPLVLELSVISGSWSESCAALKEAFTAACC